MTGQGVDCPLSQTGDWQSEEVQQRPVQQIRPVLQIPPDDRVQNGPQKTATKRSQNEFRKGFYNLISANLSLAYHILRNSLTFF